MVPPYYSDRMRNALEMAATQHMRSSHAAPPFGLANVDDSHSAHQPPLLLLAEAVRWSHREATRKWTVRSLRATGSCEPAWHHQPA